MMCVHSTCGLEGTEPLCVSAALKSNTAQHITCCKAEFAWAVLEPGLLQCFCRISNMVKVSGEERFVCRRFDFYSDIVTYLS